MMKKSILFILVAVAQVVSAQQLPNSTFDAEWVDCYPWAGENATTAKGTQPEGWCVSNVSDVVVSMPELGSVAVGVSGTGKSVKLTNTKVSIGNNVLPAYITLGTTYATAESTLLGSTQHEDGGLFGGIPFAYHPDAVRITYKCDRTGGKDEKMTFIAYLWKGTWTQKDVPCNTAVSNSMLSYGQAKKVPMTDRIHNILDIKAATGGDITKSDDAALVAKVEYSSNEAVNEWKTQDFILNYGEFAGKPVEVQKLNIVVSANNLFGTRGEIKANNSVTFDDVVLVYWHALSSLSYEGATLDFSESITSYDLSSVAYDEAKLSYTVKGQAATATTSYDEETAMLTIRVEGEDIASNPSSFTEYTIQFKTPVVGPQVMSSKTYSEDLYITVGGETTDKQIASVVVETLDNGNINFVLKNFFLGEGDSATPVGNIAVNDIEVADDGSFSFNDGIQIEAGDDPAYAGMWFGPTITMLAGGSVPVNMTGQFIGEDHVVVYITINLTSIPALSALGYVEVHLGYARATMAVNEAAKYGTFCAPFAMAIPSGVQAYTVNSATNGLLTLDEVTNSNIPANTPVVLYAENGLTTVESFDVAVSGTPTVGMLTGVYDDTEAPVGSYVLQNNDGKVGFYRVASGKQPTVTANHCYLTVPASNIKAFYFNEDDATGIENVNVNANEGAIYNVAGQRVSKIQKGINIINGKKILK